MLVYMYVYVCVLICIYIYAFLYAYVDIITNTRTCTFFRLLFSILIFLSNFFAYLLFPRMTMRREMTGTEAEIVLFAICNEYDHLLASSANGLDVGVVEAGERGEMSSTRDGGTGMNEVGGGCDDEEHLMNVVRGPSKTKVCSMS